MPRGSSALPELPTLPRSSSPPPPESESRESSHSSGPPTMVDAPRFSEPAPAAEGPLVGARIVLLVEQPSQRAQVAALLAAQGAKVIAVDPSPSPDQTLRLRELDPMMVLVDTQTLVAGYSAVLSRLGSDPRTRWAQVFPTTWDADELRQHPSGTVERLVPWITTARSADASLESELMGGATRVDIDVPLMGIARALRVIAAVGGAYALHVERSPKTYEITIVEGTITTVRRHAPGNETTATSRQEIEALLLRVLQYVDCTARVESLPAEATSHVTGVPIADLLDATAAQAFDTDDVTIARTVSASSPSIASDAPPPVRELGEERREAAKKVLAVVAGASALAVAIGLLAAPSSEGDDEASLAADPSAPAGAASAPREAMASAPGTPTAARHAANAPAKPADDKSGKGATKASETPAAVASAGERKKPRPPQNADPERPFAVGDRLTVQGCEDLVADWGTPKELSAQRAGSHWSSAKRSLMVGNLDAAKESLCLAVQLHPTGPAAEKLTSVYLLQGDVDKALATVKKLVKVAPSSKRAKDLLGDVLSFSGDEDGSLEIWLETLGVDVGDTATRAGVSERFEYAASQALKAQDALRAERMYRRSVTLNPKNVAANVGFARALYAQKKYDGALAWARHAIQLSPQSYAAHLTEGDIHKSLGDVESARTSWHTALKYAPAPALVQRRLDRL